MSVGQMFWSPPSCSRCPPSTSSSPKEYCPNCTSSEWTPVAISKWDLRLEAKETSASCLMSYSLPNLESDCDDDIIEREERAKEEGEPQGMLMTVVATWLDKNIVTSKIPFLSWIVWKTSTDLEKQRSKRSRARRLQRENSKCFCCTCY